MGEAGVMANLSIGDHYDQHHELAQSVLLGQVPASRWAAPEPAPVLTLDVRAYVQGFTCTQSGHPQTKQKKTK